MRNGTGLLVIGIWIIAYIACHFTIKEWGLVIFAVSVMISFAIAHVEERNIRNTKKQ